MAAPGFLTAPLAAALWLGAAALAAAQQPTVPGAQPPPAAVDTGSALARSAVAVAAAKAELAERLRIYDAALTMRVLAAELAPDAAARELARIALEQAARPPGRAVPPDTFAAHRQAAERLFAVIERRARTDAAWPRDRGAEDYRLFARVWLHRLRNDYNDALMLDDDASNVLLETESLLMLTRGQADFDTAKGVFAAADARIAAALTSVERAAAQRRAMPAATTPTARATPPVASAPPGATAPPGSSTVTRSPAGTTTTVTPPLAPPPHAPSSAGTSIAPIPGMPPAAHPPARPAQATANAPTLTWVGRGADRVAPGASGQPDGKLDGQFRLGVHLPQRGEIASITLFSSDADGQPTGPHRWHTQTQRYWVLGVVVGGRQMNTTHVPSLGTFAGSFVIDLFAADAGSFSPGQHFTVEMTLADGSRQRQITRLP